MENHMRWRPILYAPPEYWALTPVDHSMICNGCGAANSKFDFVPDTVWGLSITPACNIHDYMYHTGVNESDKQFADNIFLNNMLRLVEREEVTSWWRRILRMLRRRRCLKYYEAVVAFGGPAFYKS